MKASSKQINSPKPWKYRRQTGRKSKEFQEQYQQMTTGRKEKKKNKE